LFSVEKEGGQEEGPRLRMVLNRTGPSFVEVVRSDLCPDATVMPIVGGFPSSYAEVVRSDPLHHTKLWAPLVEPCAIDILATVRYVDCEGLRSAMDCSVLEIPPFDSMVKKKLLRPLGKKNLKAGLFVRGLAGSARMTNSRLNLRTWSKMLVRFNLVVGRVFGKLLGSVWAIRLKVFVWAVSCLNPTSKRQWKHLSKKKKETMEVSEDTGPVSDLEAGLVFA
jgi:hypothetical protein